MKKNKHISPLTIIPANAQVSNFQIKLQATTDIIDRLLLVPRQAPWKATGPTEETTETNTNVDTGTITGGTTTGV